MLSRIDSEPNPSEVYCLATNQNWNVKNLAVFIIMIFILYSDIRYAPVLHWYITTEAKGTYFDCK